jgi:hypothetical protein
VSALAPAAPRLQAVGTLLPACEAQSSHSEAGSDAVIALVRLLARSAARQAFEADKLQGIYQTTCSGDSFR